MEPLQDQAYQILETRFARWVGWTDPINVVGCSSGTASLHLALEAPGLPPGAEVILPDFSMVACPRAVVLAGLVPVFVDCGPDLLMNVEQLGTAISDKTVAIMPVHIYGRRCNMDAIVSFAKKHLLSVIEDMAEIHGVSPHQDSDAACWSFYKNKIIHGEEGGAVAFNKNFQRVAHRARELRSLGFTEAHDFTHAPRGHNYRLSNAHASLILQSLDAYEEEVNQREDIMRWYHDLCPPKWRMPSRQAPWVYDIRIGGMTPYAQNEIVRSLSKVGVAARHAFKPMHMQAEFKDNLTVQGGRMAEVMAREVVYFPIQPGVTTKEKVEETFEVVKRVVAEWVKEP